MAVHFERKEDGLLYAYDYRYLIFEEDEMVWKIAGTHYDRQSIYRSAEDDSQYSRVVVERFLHNNWIVDIEWLEKYKNNNRHNI